MRATVRRSGLTLVELVVVLVVLVALAGIVLPMLPNMLGRANVATCSTNIPEIAKAIQTYENIHFSQPDGWDALTDGTNLVDYLPNKIGQINAEAVGDAEVEALKAIGIKTVYLMGKTTSDVAHLTFHPYNNDTTSIPTATTITKTTKLAFVAPAEASRILNVSSTGRYVIFGLGKKCSMISRTMQEAPFHFGEVQSEAPTEIYCRFAVIYKVSDSTLMNPPLERAQLVGIVALHPDPEGMSTNNAHIEEYYNITKTTK